jgi:hypothetical protein
MPATGYPIWWLFGPSSYTPTTVYVTLLLLLAIQHSGSLLLFMYLQVIGCIVATW